MTLLILDPDLAGASGPSAIEAEAIAREAARRGERVVILAARGYAGRMPEGVQVVPFFTHRSDAVLHDDPVTGRFDDFSTLNDALAAELALIPRVETRAVDAVLVPHAGVNQLVGFAAWMKSFDPLEAPLFFLRFAGPRLGEGQAPDGDPLEALFRRLGLRVAAEAGPPIHLCAAGRALAADWAAWAGCPVEAMPAPICPAPLARQPGVAPRAAVLAPPGAANTDALMRALAAAQPVWSFVLCGEAPSFEGARPANLSLFEGGGSLPAGTDLLLVLPWQGPEPMQPLWEALALGIPMLLPRNAWMAREAALWGEFLGAYPPGASTDQIARHVTGAIHRLDELNEMAEAAAGKFRGANGAAVLMDRLGLLWAARIAAASLLVRERESVIDLARLRAEGWHKLEEKGGQPVRWTAGEPEIAFDWPFHVPWQLRLHLLRHPGEEMLRGVEARCGDATLPVAILRDAGGTVLRIDGRPGDAARPLTAVRVVLPQTWRAPDDPRDLGVLVSAITVRALQAGPAAVASSLPAVGVRAAPAAEGGWPLDTPLSGEVTADGRDPVALVLTLDLPGGPAQARGLALHLNGVPLRLDLTPGPGARWTAQAVLPAAVMRTSGLLAAWDLAAPGGTDGARLLEVQVARVAGTQAPPGTGALPAAVPDEAPSADAATARRGRWWRGS